MELSVVIPVRNAESFLPELLDSLAAQQWEGSWEVVVVDNGSEDGSVELIERYRERLPALAMLEAVSGAGSAYGRNIGARGASATSLLFIDHDDVPGEGYVAAMGEALRDHEFVCSRWEVERLNPEWTRALRPSAQADGPMLWNYDFLPYAAGGTLGVRRAMFESVGGFDESVVTADCTDFCWRAQLQAAAELVFVPRAVMHYRYRQSLRTMFSQARLYGRAEVDMYARYRSRGIKPIPLRRSAQRWKEFIRHLPRLRYKAGRAWLFTELGNRIGRIEGSLAKRTIML
ncbi:MAG: glycosyltransferase [Actinomycetota bacterium]|nr:glycosyltransferase [Actinomycetota bacterium]